MTATMAALDAALKNDYQPAIREQLVNNWMLLSQLETNTKDVQGRYAVLSLHVGRNSGVGARASGAALPTAGRQRYLEERVLVKRNYASITIDGDLIAASASDKGSFARMLEAETKGAMTDLKDDVSRQIYNDATRSIARCGTTSSSTTVTLTATDASMRQFHLGMKVDIGTTASPQSIAADREVTAINRAAGTIVISGAAVTTNNTHYVTRAGSLVVNELTGIREIISDTGTLFNVDSSVETVWRSVVNANGGTNRTPTEVLFEKVIEDIHFESDMEPNLIVTTKGVRRNFAAQYQGQRQYNNSIDIKAGFKAVTITAGNSELPLVVDNDAPNNQAAFINTGCMYQHQMGKGWGFLDRDGSVLHLKSGYDQYEAWIGNYHELTTDRRNAHGRLTDLTEA